MLVYREYLWLCYLVVKYAGSNPLRLTLYSLLFLPLSQFKSYKTEAYISENWVRKRVCGNPANPRHCWPNRHYIFLVRLSWERRTIEIFATQAPLRKRLVMSQRRYEGACNRIADANVTFCERGGAAAWVNSDFCIKNQSKRYIACSDVEALNLLDIFIFDILSFTKGS